MMKHVLWIFAALAAAAGARAAEAPPAPPPAAELANTIIRSEHLEMRNDGVETHFVFTGSVRLTGTNLEVTCDKLEAFATQKGDRSAAIGKVGGLRRILATGSVVISQAGRRATAGRAEVLPNDEKIVLTEQPEVTDLETQVTMGGERMTFFRDQRYAQIEKPTVVGPAMPNLGFPRQPADAPSGSRDPAAPAEGAETPPEATPPPQTPPAEPAPQADPDRPRVTFPATPGNGG